MRYPRYMTFGNEELEAAIRQVDPERRNGATGEQMHCSGGGAGGRLLKNHSCAVLFPDGTTGTAPTSVEDNAGTNFDSAIRAGAASSRSVPASYRVNT